MKCTDFYDYPKGLSQAKYAAKKPKLENCQVVKFSRGSPKMFWKVNHSDKKFNSSLFLQKKYVTDIGRNNFVQCVENRGVKSSKKENIIEVLCPHMKERSKSFWQNLFVNESSVDLVTERDPSEENQEN